MNVTEITQNIFYENFIMSESHDVKLFFLGTSFIVQLFDFLTSGGSRISRRRGRQPSRGGVPTYNFDKSTPLDLPMTSVGVINECLKTELVHAPSISIVANVYKQSRNVEN